MGQVDQGISVGIRYQVIPRVLIFLRTDEEILLLKGSPTKRIWANKYNGLGGHVELGEDIYQAAVRELEEESGLTADLKLHAVVNIDAGDPATGILMFVFIGWLSERLHTERSDEGSLHWVHKAKVNQLELVEDLYWLLPRLIDLPENSDKIYYLHYGYDQDDQLKIDENGR